MRRVIRTAVLAAAVLVPTAVFAQVQATITGTVKDTSGAVLPGVTVEVASPGVDREDALGRHRRLGTVPDC